jgi:TPR repeat protein
MSVASSTAAIDKLRQQAESGNVIAMYAFGMKLQKGDGVAQDAAAGAQYILRAALCGNV